jgi:hypothetical protein
MKTTPCKGCGKPIFFARDVDTGALLPLDARAGGYAVTVEGKDVTCTRNGNVYISHFLVCPKAREFSRAERKAT